MEPVDPELLQRARLGDRRALGALAEAHWPEMRRLAYVELGDRALAEDACQDALMRLVRFISTYDPARPFGAWLRTLVRHAARDVATRRRRRIDRERAVPRASAPRDVDHRLDLARSASRAFAAFQALPARQRQLVELVDRGGLSPTEAGVELGITAGAARSQLFAARRALREHLIDQRAEVVALLRET